jgi:hypothetical protein
MRLLQGPQRDATPLDCNTRDLCMHYAMENHSSAPAPEVSFQPSCSFLRDGALSCCITMTPACMRAGQLRAAAMSLLVCIIQLLRYHDVQVSWLGSGRRGVMGLQTVVTALRCNARHVEGLDTGIVYRGCHRACLVSTIHALPVVGGRVTANIVVLHTYTQAYIHDLPLTHVFRYTLSVWQL